MNEQDFIFIFWSTTTKKNVYEKISICHMWSTHLFIFYLYSYELFADEINHKFFNRHQFSPLSYGSFKNSPLVSSPLTLMIQSERYIPKEDMLKETPTDVENSLFYGFYHETEFIIEENYECTCGSSQNSNTVNWVWDQWDMNVTQLKSFFFNKLKIRFGLDVMSGTFLWYWVWLASLFPIRTITVRNKIIPNPRMSKKKNLKKLCQKKHVKYWEKPHTTQFLTTSSSLYMWERILN